MANYTNMLGKNIDCAEVLKPLRNERDLAQEVDRLSQSLKDSQTTDWKQRTKDLKRI